MCNAVMYVDIGRLFDTCSREGLFCFFLSLSVCRRAGRKSVNVSCSYQQVLHLVQTTVEGMTTLSCRAAALCQHIKTSVYGRMLCRFFSWGFNGL